MPAHEQSQVDQTSTAKPEAPAPAPDLDLAEIIPLAVTLSSRLTALENKVSGLLDISEVESKFAEIEENLMDPAGQLQRLKDSKDYGSDVPLVMETLMACAKTSSNVAEAPAPQVLFLSFGESSLDFELRVWVLDADHRLKVKSELHQAIDQRFREANIEIAFPQRDLHLRSLDESVILQTTKLQP